MVGPLAGGLIVEHFHWSVIFFIDVPIGLVGLYLVYRHLPDFREERTSPLDIAGVTGCGASTAVGGHSRVVIRGDRSHGKPSDYQGNQT